MADILKITTPLNNKNPIPPNKQVLDPSADFQISDLTKIIKTTNESGLQGHNNSLIDKDTASNLLSNLIKDPAVTISYLKNIFLLQEVIKLLPVNNTSFTQEIQMLFESLIISKDMIKQEMINQEYASTLFKGDLFEFLRSFIKNSESLEKNFATANLLKALNKELSQKDIIDSIINSLGFIKKQINTSEKLSKEIDDLIALIKQNQPQGFKEVKENVINTLKNVEQSILYNNKVEKVISLIIYNMSRFNDNPNNLRESIDYFLNFINEPSDKQKFINLIKNFLESYNEKQKNISKVMDALTEIVKIQSSDENIQSINSEKIDKIIKSLLSSPCNFTPLLHFIVPVEYMNIKSLAEMWIEFTNKDESKNEASEDNENIHMLIVFEVEGIGQIETEIFLVENDISLTMAFPKQHVKAFESIKEPLIKSVENTQYRFSNINIQEYSKTKSLMEVFKDLPKKRTGLDVKI